MLTNVRIEDPLPRFASRTDTKSPSMIRGVNSLVSLVLTYDPPAQTMRQGNIIIGK